MKRILVVAGLALVLAACGSRATTTGTPTGRTAADPASPRAVTARAVALILHRVPLPSGAHSATEVEAATITWQERSDSPNLVAEHATYVVPMSADAVLAWYGTHPPPEATPEGSSSSSDGRGVTTQGLEFGVRRKSAAYAYPEVQVGVQSPSTDEALLRIDVQATWIPRDHAVARVPRGATSVDVVRVDDSRDVRRATLTGVPVRRLADLLNRQHVVSPGTYNCPNDHGGHDVLTFHGPWPDHVYAVSPEGCGFIEVRVGAQRLDTSFFGGGVVDALLQRLLARSSRR